MSASLVIMVCYSSQKNEWRGFCVPYDVTCDATSPDELKRKLENLVKLYEEGLKLHSYPQHLTFKKLSDPEDRKVFTKVWPKIKADIEARKKSYGDYVKNLKQDMVIRDKVKSFVSYLDTRAMQPC